MKVKYIVRGREFDFRRVGDHIEEITLFGAGGLAAFCMVIKIDSTLLQFVKMILFQLINAARRLSWGRRYFIKGGKT